MPSYYELLGVKDTASTDELRRAYRKKARALHPDQNPGDHEAEAQFKQVAEAYATLSDAQKREAYDASRRPAPAGAASWFGGSFENLSEQFAPRGWGPTPRGRDVLGDVTVSFLQAWKGAEVPLRLKVEEACAHCHGQGGEPGNAQATCTACQGSGKHSKWGAGAFATTCLACNGTGRVPTRACTQCLGARRVESERTVTARIPLGINDGQKLRLRGHGERGEGGNGDILLTVHVEPHPTWQLRGKDLLMDLPVTYPELMLGADATAQLPEGSVKVKIPAGSRLGTQLRVSGKGAGGSEPGALLLTLTLAPTRLTERAKELLMQLHPELDPPRGGA